MAKDQDDDPDEERKDKGQVETCHEDIYLYIHGGCPRNLVVSGNRNDPLHENEVEQGDSHGHWCKPFNDDEAGNHALVFPRYRVHDHIGYRREHEAHPEAEQHEACNHESRRGVYPDHRHHEEPCNDRDTGEDAE